MFPLATTAPEPPCQLVIWRHLINTGGTALRLAFEELMLTTGSWQAMSRLENSYTVKDCSVYTGIYQIEALSRFLACVRSQGKGGTAYSASAEYHVPPDSQEFRGHVEQLPLGVSPSIARALVVTVVRDPYRLIRAEYSTFRAVYQRRKHLNTPELFIKGWVPDQQCGELFRYSIRERQHIFECPRDIDQHRFWRSGGVGLKGLLDHFDVVGVTEQLAGTVLLICSRIGLRHCPILGHANHADSRDHFEWNETLRELARPLVKVDVRLHQLATERLQVDLQIVDGQLVEDYRAAVERGPVVCGYYPFEFTVYNRSASHSSFRDLAKPSNTRKERAGALEKAPSFVPSIKVRNNCCLTHRKLSQSSRSPTILGHVCNTNLPKCIRRRKTRSMTGETVLVCNH